MLTDNLEIKGFRKGKVPAEIAKKHINADKVRSEAVNVAIDAN
jgi:FKBP-type peptidyl-prolyl cis-trans isomerase (trigger factor)